MRYEYTHLIPQNVAPSGVNKIGVYKDGKKIFSIPVGRLTPPEGEKLYSFGLISDTHLAPASYGVAEGRFDAALTWFEGQGAAFVCHAGDITNHGLQNSDGTADLQQFAEFKKICDQHPNLPVYAVCGNHDSYFSPITNNLTELEEYTGHGLYYTITYQSDLFVFIGQPSSGSPMNEDELTWLESLVVRNADKRCFVFIHPYISSDSGNTLNIYGNALLPASSTITARLKTALISHGKSVIFHGHSHFMQSMQELDETTNYTNKNGFHSVHVPSVGFPAYVANGSRTQSTTESYGYLVDVYDGYIMLRGIDFVNDKWSAHGTYKIDV